MRPHRLELTAFGPFAETTVIDFDTLAESGLFLLHGETGAGKTTLLDALSYALFGSVPGTRGIQRLRSDHLNAADAAVRTKVRLDLTVGGRRLRVTRWPAWERPKLRGSGTTVEPAKVAFEELVDGGWAPRSTRFDEVGEELSRLLGMSAEQFHQVVVLPQGEFARFLRSDDSDRERLLRRLFAIDRFHHVEQWLAERRREMSRRVDEAWHGARRLLARLAQVADVTEPAELPSAEWVEQLRRETQGLAEAAQETAATAENGWRERRQAAEQTRLLAARQRRRRTALDELAELERRADEVAQLGSRVQLARRAAAVVSPLHEARRRQRQRAAAEAAEQRCRLALPEVLQAASVEQLRTALAEAQQGLGRLDEAAEWEAEISRWTSLATAAEREREQADDDVARLGTVLATLPKEQAQAKAAVEAGRRAETTLPELRGRLEREQAAARDVRQRDELAEQVRVLDEQHGEARQRAVELRERAADLREARYDAMIAELVADLVDDAPCPVCGSLQHPDPAHLPSSSVTREDEQRARRTAEQAQEAAGELAKQCAAVEARLEQIREQLRAAGHEGAAPDELDAECARLTDEIGELGQTVEHGVVSQRQLDALGGREVELREELAAAQRRMAEADARADAARRERDQLVARLHRLVGDGQDVEGARRAACRHIDLLAAAADAVQASVAAREAEAQALAAAEAAAQQAGFADAAAAADAVLPEGECERLEREVATHREEWVRLTGLLADPELAVELEPMADVAAAEQSAGQAEREWEEACRQQDRWSQRARQLDELCPRYLDALAALAPLQQQADEVRALADLAAGNGGNRLRMSLSSYVLAARLEEVAEAASLRLARMTQGRYTLVHTDESRGGKRSGLRLLARDAWTGQDRDTATLSGGETFMASLALALGLADVVSAAAGGVRLDALFVDEGFGSLDEETLDEVLDVLDGLREGGRMVGLVSHVAELRQRIPAQVRVHKGRAGSTVSCTTGIASGPESL